MTWGWRVPEPKRGPGLQQCRVTVGKNHSPSVSALPQKELISEFRELQATVERMGLMKANRVFFLLCLLHIVLLDVAGWLTLWVFGTSFVPFILCAVLLSVAQVRSRHLGCQERGHAPRPWGKLLSALGGHEPGPVPGRS